MNWYDDDSMAPRHHAMMVVSNCHHVYGLSRYFMMHRIYTNQSLVDLFLLLRLILALVSLLQQVAVHGTVQQVYRVPHRLRQMVADE